jgi:hypothetical protein
MWKVIGLSQTERSTEIQALGSSLIKRYQTFMAQTNTGLEDLRGQLK